MKTTGENPDFIVKNFVIANNYIKHKRLNTAFVNSMTINLGSRAALRAALLPKLICYKNIAVFVVKNNGNHR